MRRLSTALSAAFILAALPSASPAAPVQRVSHTATLLTTGDLLIAGGVNELGATLNSADIVATSRGPVIIPIAAFGVARASHTATLLPNGCVFIAGGNAAASDAVAAVPTNDTQIYNPATGLWTSPGTLGTARYNHTASLLNDGRVLICGGQSDNAGTALASCEFYTPASCTAGAFSAAPSLLQARYNHTAVLLKNSMVWFAGGTNPAIVATGGYLATTERYNPGTNAFQSASPMIEARSQHTATLMGDGRALVVGGYNLRDVIANKGVTESAEIYDPVSNSVSPAATMSARRHAHAAVLSANGSVDVFGGLGSITTTFIDASKILDTGSSINFAPITAPTATITGGNGLLPLDYLLNKPVVGVIQNGEMWLSSPTIKTAWGAIYFTPSSETNPLVGVRVNLAGQAAGCNLPFPPVALNCGSIRTLPGAAASLSQMQGQAVFYRLVTVVPIGSPIVNSGTLNLPGTLDSTNLTRNLLASSNVNTDLTITVDKAFIGKTINSGYLNISAGSLVQIGSFTVVLSSGGGNIPPTLVASDASGNGKATFNITFNNLAGVATYTGQAPQTFGPAITVPLAGTVDPLSLTMSMTYTTNGANLSGESFRVDISTVVIRKMIFADHETYNPKANSWALTPADGVVQFNQRYGHSATLLPNNDTIFYGGRACLGAACAAQTASATTGIQLVYSEKNFANPAGVAAGRRAFHTATLMPGGDVLVAGGTNGPSILSSAELFTPATETFSPIQGSMRYVRDLHTATLLPNGRVLIAGGFTTNAASTGSTNTSEIYYPDTKIFLETAPMISSRSNHSAIMLPDGRVFAAGGFGTNSALQNDVTSDTSEIYISTQGRWIPAANMPAGCERALHATVQLKDGRILLIGGVNASGVLATTARYDPTLNTWNCAAVAAMPTPLRSHSANLLFDGRVLVAGGNDGLGEANVSYIYDPASNTWTATDPLPLLQPRFNHTATLLPNGNVMISGGSQRFGDVPKSIEIFHVNASSWVTGGVTFNAGARAFHTMTLALNNKMYGIGGSDGVVGGTGVSLYNNVEAGYFTATPDGFTKNAPPSFRQSTIATTSASPFLPGTNLTVNGNQFRGGTEASGGGAASGNSAFSFPHMILQQVDGSGGAAAQSNGGFVVDLTTQIFLNPANLATLNTSLTVALPLTSAALPYGWYALRTGANDLYSDGKLVQVGPAKPVAAPANVAGVAAGVSSMTWTWDVIAGVDGYNVYNATTGVFLSSIPVSLATRATYYQTALDPSATASIIIGGYTLSGDGPLSASPTSYTLSTTPVNVTIASVTFSDLLLYWGTNGNSFPGTIYEVTQSSDNFVANISTPVPQLFSLSRPFTTITNLSANTTYFFRIRAFNPIGLASPYSISVSTRTRAPVTQPVVSARATTSIDWGWADPGGVNNYRVYNATSGVLLGTPVLNSFTDVNLGTNTVRSIVVSAVTTAGEGPLSPSATAFTAAASPGLFAPPATPTTGSLLVNWTNNGNPLLTQYKLALTEFASNGTIVGVQTTTTTAFSQGFGPLNPSTKYKYEIVGVNGDGLDSDIPPVVFGTTWTLPTAPNPLAALGTTPTTISVGWSANNNSSSATYQVTYSTDNFALNIATAVAFGAKFGGTNFTIPGLVTGATYSVRVLASNPFGQLSQFSNTITTRTFNGGAPVGSIQGPLLAAADSSLFGSLGNGRQILLRAPARTFPSDVLVTVSSFVPTGTLCPNATNIAFSIVNTPALQPTGSLYLTFGFAAAELGTIPSGRALLLRYDPGSNTCVPLETTIDTANGQMTARINHFSLFQVGQVPLSTTAETARLFPNPYYTGRDGFLTIDNVPAGARVRIFTLRGEQVLDVKANSTGLLTWSGTNGFGRAVASGVYLVMVESGATKKILKLAVIR